MEESRIKALHNLVDAEDIKSARLCDTPNVSGIILCDHIRELMGWELCEEARETWTAFHRKGDLA